MTGVPIIKVNFHLFLPDLKFFSSHNGSIHNIHIYNGYVHFLLPPEGPGYRESSAKIPSWCVSVLFLSFFFFNVLFLFTYLAAPDLSCNKRDLASDQGLNLSPCLGSTESQPLDHQGRPLSFCRPFAVRHTFLSHHFDSDSCCCWLACLPTCCLPPSSLCHLPLAKAHES